MTEAEHTPRIGGAFTVTAIVLSLVSWRVAFNLGAFGEVFYEDIFAVLVASTVLFVVIVVTRPFRPGRNSLAGVVLAAPSMWFAAAVVVAGSTNEALERPVFAISLAVVIAVSIPVTLRLLITVFYPELSALNGRTLARVVLVVAAVIAVVGFLFGRHNDVIMTCSDFEVAGAFQPENCVRGE